jgi:succinate-acetate transporter protein
MRNDISVRHLSLWISRPSFWFYIRKIIIKIVTDFSELQPLNTSSIYLVVYKLFQLMVHIKTLQMEGLVQK